MTSDSKPLHPEGFPERDWTSQEAARLEHAPVCPPVDPLVAVEGGPVVELLPALATFIGLLSGVSAVVDGEVRLLREDFPALVTFIGLLPRMASVVHGEV